MAISKGTRKLTWFAETYFTGAATPATDTDVSPSFLGSGTLEANETAAASFVP